MKAWQKYVCALGAPLLVDGAIVYSIRDRAHREDVERQEIHNKFPRLKEYYDLKRQIVDIEDHFRENPAGAFLRQEDKRYHDLLLQEILFSEETLQGVKENGRVGEHDAVVGATYGLLFVAPWLLMGFAFRDYLVGKELR